VASDRAAKTRSRWSSASGVVVLKLTIWFSICLHRGYVKHL
jgi:hypothetical protein